MCLYPRRWRDSPAAPRRPSWPQQTSPHGAGAPCTWQWRPKQLTCEGLSWGQIGPCCPLVGMCTPPVLSPDPSHPLLACSLHSWNIWIWEKDDKPSFCSSVQSLSCVWFFETPWTAAHQASLSITNSQNLLNLTSIKSVMPSNHLILCCSFLLLPSIFPSIRVSILHIRWPKYCSFSFSVSPSNEYSGVISFRIDWLDLLAVQGIRKSLLQHHSSKALILWCSAFFTVQLSHPYMTTGKTIALIIWTFDGKVIVSAF